MAKLFVICGHGAGDSGAVGGGKTEADLVRQLADRLKALGGSAVQVGDTSVNWYKSNYIGKGECPKGVPVIELHMDSSSASAKGGHVIIWGGYNPDEYDNALADFINGMFPGRSTTISKRTDLANPRRAASMGVNYRLLECCFISNASDRARFIDKMDELARGILSAFGIKGGSGSSGASASDSSKPSTGGSTSAKKTVSQLADEVVAGKWGNGDARRKKLEASGYDYSAVQAEVNRRLGASPGKKSVNDAVVNAVIRGDYGNGATRKAKLEAAGYDYSAVQAAVNRKLGA